MLSNMTSGEAVQATPVGRSERVESAAPRRRTLRPYLFGLTITTLLLLLFGVPWWVLVMSGAQWPAPVVAVGTVVFAGALVAFPLLMVLGHGRHHDRAAVAGDTILGVIWVMFVWSILGNVLRLGLLVAGVPDPARSRVVAAAVLVVSLVLVVWGYVEAMRVPRVRRVEVTHPAARRPASTGSRSCCSPTRTTARSTGPAGRRGVTEAVNKLDADIVCHTGDIADGTVAERREQAAPLGDVRAKLARAYVTGNHEYFGEAEGWLEHMRELGWEPLHNRHIVVERDGARLVVAGVDDRTAASSGLPGHRADHAAALAGADPDLPVLLLAHQPKQIGAAVEHGVDLQLSGHTHGGQIWPFHYLVRTRPAGRARPDPARRAHPALHEPRHRLLGAAVAGLRPERDHAADPAF